MDLSGIITLRNTFYYRTGYRRFIHAVCSSEFCANPKNYSENGGVQFDLFHLGRISPRMDIYHYRCNNEKKDRRDAERKAERSVITAFRLDSSKFYERVASEIDRAFSMRKGNKDTGEFVLIDVCDQFAKESLIFCQIFKDSGFSSAVKTMTPPRSGRTKKTDIAFRWKDTERDVLKSDLCSVKGFLDANKEQREKAETYERILKCLLDISERFSKFQYCLLRAKPSPNSHLLQRILEKTNDLYKTVSNYLKLCKLRLADLTKRVNDSEVSFKDPYFVIGRENVCSLVAPVEFCKGIEDLSTEPVPSAEQGREKKRIQSEVASFESILSVLGVLFRYAPLNDMFFGEKEALLDRHAAFREDLQDCAMESPSRSIAERTMLRRKQYKFDNDYHVFLRFSGNQPLDKRFLDIFPPAIAYGHSHSFDEIFDDLLDEPKEKTRFSPLVLTDGTRTFMSERRTVVTCFELLHPEKPIVRGGRFSRAAYRMQMSHAFRYQALNEFWSLVTVASYSSMAIAVNYLCAAMATQVEKIRQKPWPNIFALHNFSVIASRTSAFYGETTMFKRTSGTLSAKAVMDHYSMERNEKEAAESIEGLWQKTNITYSNHYGRSSLILSVMAIVEAMIVLVLVGENVTVSQSSPDPFDLIGELWSKAEIRFVSIVLIVTLLVLLGWFVADWFYRLSHPLRKYIDIEK